MSRPKTLLDIMDGRPFVKASRIRFGKVEVRGVPAILLGVAAVVAAARLGEALIRAATALPETLRETREVLLAARTPRELTTLR